MNLEKVFSKEISSLKQELKKPAGSFLLVGLDKQLIFSILEILQSSTKKPFINYKSIKETETLVNKVLIIDLDALKTLNQQTLVYHALETTNLFVILISNSCFCIENMEKRIRSRFNHKKYFINYFPTKSIIPTFDCTNNQKLIDKYKLDSYSTEQLVGLLTDLHLQLIIMNKEKPITHVNLVSDFRQFMINKAGHKRLANGQIKKAYFDLLNLNILDEKGNFKISYLEFKKVINEKRSLFIRNIL